MPMLDHFHPPLSVERHWESFLAKWACEVADRLNVDLLPEGYFAEVRIHIGGCVEVETDTPELVPPTDWTPPRPDLQIPAIFPDAVETLIFSTESGPTLVGAVEFVSPGNKDRPEARRAFAAKCASYLQEGIGLVVVDIVTNRRANLHNELIALLGLGEECRMPGDQATYATAYRPFRLPSTEATDVWLAGLAVGEALPTLPLALRRGPCLPIDLDSTYAGLLSRNRLKGHPERTPNV